MEFCQSEKVGTLIKKPCSHLACLHQISRMVSMVTNDDVHT